MDFRDSPEEAAFRAQARAWLEANAPLRDPADIEPGVFENWPTETEMQAARAWQRRKHDAGWAGVFWPTEYGGRGGSIMQQIIWNQEERRVVTPPAVLLMGQGHVGYTLLAHGTDDQKARWLQPLVPPQVKPAAQAFVAEQFARQNARGEVAVGALLRAERHMDVEADRLLSRQLLEPSPVGLPLGLAIAGRRVLVEELLRGRELSVLVVTDGRTIAVLEADVQAFRRLIDTAPAEVTP